MKMKQLFVACGMAVALFLSVGIASAQQDNGGGGGGNGGGGGGNGGGGGGNGGGGGMRQRGGNFDPAQMMQRMMDGVRDQLGFTNDTDWSAVQPLVQKVMDARREVGGNGMMRMFRGNRGGGQQRQGRGGFGGTPSPEEEALQKAIDDNAPSGQVKELLTKYQAVQKTKQAALVSAQDALRGVLTVKQEAQATLLGLL